MGTVHVTHVKLASGYALELAWWASDPRVATSIQTTYDKMQMTLRG